MATELNTEAGMHIESDPKTGAIAAPVVVPEIQKVIDAKADAPEPKAQEDAEPEKIDPRKAIMDKIYANRSEQFKKELDTAAAADLGATTDAIVDEAPVLDRKDVADEPKVEAVAEAKPQPKAEAPAKRSINIGGQQYELTEAEIEQLAQRAVYAENHIRQQEARPQYQQPQQQQIQQPAPQDVALDAVQLKEIARRITYGSEEESTRALADFAGLTADLARKTTNSLPPEQLVQVATANAVAQVRFENDLQTIASEYADVFENRSKSLIAADKVGLLRQKYAQLGMPKTQIELYREACSETQKEFGARPETATVAERNNPSVQQVVTRVNQNRVERKRAAPQPISAVNKTQQMSNQSAYPSGSDIVSAMRKSRGQPST